MWNLPIGPEPSPTQAKGLPFINRNVLLAPSPKEAKAVLKATADHTTAKEIVNLTSVPRNKRHSKTLLWK